mmetsp:Transcript_23813/g.55536  ORF Transcript_23813/g.55536 Transcript_23813/m.55536 type:complete len:204 (-) Transcript_23813:428-1039(-)
MSNSLSSSSWSPASRSSSSAFELGLGASSISLPSVSLFFLETCLVTTTVSWLPSRKKSSWSSTVGSFDVVSFDSWAPCPLFSRAARRRSFRFCFFFSRYFSQGVSSAPPLADSSLLRILSCSFCLPGMNVTCFVPSSSSSSSSMSLPRPNCVRVLPSLLSASPSSSSPSSSSLSKPSCLRISALRCSASDSSPSSSLELSDAK